MQECSYDDKVKSGIIGTQEQIGEAIKKSENSIAKIIVGNLSLDTEFKILDSKFKIINVNSQEGSIVCEKYEYAWDNNVRGGLTFEVNGIKFIIDSINPSNNRIKAKIITKE
jgi:hypothetical protein